MFRVRAWMEQSKRMTGAGQKLKLGRTRVGAGAGVVHILNFIQIVLKHRKKLK